MSQDDRLEVRMRMQKRETASSLFACLMVLGLAGCSTYKTYTTESLPRQQEIKIDGKTDDWLGALSIIEDGSASVGFRNDREVLYVCLVVEREFLEAQIMRQGLTVWFDPRGGKTKSLGIRYPLAMPQREMTGEPPGEPGQPRSKAFPEEALSQLEIISSQKEEPQKMRIDEARGIEIAAVSSRGLFVYELKMPLFRTESQLIAVGAKPGQTIGIGFETPKPDRSQMPGPPSGGMPGGGRPPMGGRSGARGRGRPGGAAGEGPGSGMRGEMANGLKVWALVRLNSGEIDRLPQLLSTSEIAD